MTSHSVGVLNDELTNQHTEGIMNLEIQDSFCDLRSLKLTHYYKATILISTDEHRGRNTYRNSFIYKIDDTIISDILVLVNISVNKVYIHERRSPTIN